MHIHTRLSVKQTAKSRLNVRLLSISTCGMFALCSHLPCRTHTFGFLNHTYHVSLHQIPCDRFGKIFNILKYIK